MRLLRESLELSLSFSVAILLCWKPKPSLPQSSPRDHLPFAMSLRSLRVLYLRSQ
jgi:hypothetical protein